jgi:hypothetical protein
MSAGKQLFRIVCLLQMLATVFFGFLSFTNLITSGRFYFMLESIFFMLIASLSILGLNLLHTNYPDRPIVGKQKSVFNWLFLFNFLLLSFLFGLFFSEYRQLNTIREFAGRRLLSLPFRILLPLLMALAILIFQFIILYGLYNLRRELYFNFTRNKRFEFEEEKTTS